jgi:hypothetical protein
MLHGVAYKTYEPNNTNPIKISPHDDFRIRRPITSATKTAVATPGLS